MAKRIQADFDNYKKRVVTGQGGHRPGGQRQAHPGAPQHARRPGPGHGDRLGRGRAARRASGRYRSNLLSLLKGLRAEGDAQRMRVRPPAARGVLQWARARKGKIIRGLPERLLPRSESIEAFQSQSRKEQRRKVNKMAKIIGIDLGTSNSAAAVMEGGRPSDHPQRRGHQHRREGVPVVRGIHQGRAAAGRRTGQASGRLQPGGDHRGHQAEDGDGLQGQRQRQGVHPPADIRVHPAEDKAGRRGLPGRDRHQGGHHRPGLLQRQPEARPPRTPAPSPAWRSCASSTSRRRRPWPTVWTRRARNRRSWSSTWAAVRSMSPSWTSAQGVFEVISTSGDTQLGGTDMDEILMNVRRPASSSKETGIDLTADKMAM